MTAVSHVTSSRPARHRPAIRPRLLPAITADTGEAISPLSVSRDRQSLAVSGEIDESSFCFFADALDALAWGLSPLHIDLAGVKYCDIAGLRLMVRLTRSDDLTGEQEGARRVVLHGAAPHLRALLGILGWDRTPGLTLS